MIATAGGLPTLVGLLEAPALPVQAMASLAIAEVCAIHTSQVHARPHATMLPRYRTHPSPPLSRSILRTRNHAHKPRPIICAAAR